LKCACIAILGHTTKRISNPPRMRHLVCEPPPCLFRVNGSIPPAQEQIERNQASWVLSFAHPCPLVPLTPWKDPGIVNTRLGGICPMTTCPACNHDVTTPFFLNMDAWRHLACPHCQAQLEMKSPRSFVLGPLIAPLFVLARQGHVFEIIAFVFMFATIFLLLLESVRPKLRLRKRPFPKPTIRLNIGGPSN